MNLNNTIFNLCNENKGLREFLISKGYDNLKNDNTFKMMSKMVSLKSALSLKGIDEDIFLEEFNNYSNQKLEEEAIKNDESSKTVVVGAVPCPIRVPLIDHLNEFNEKNNITNIKYDLRSANLGTDFIKGPFYENDVEKFPNLITSAGYELILEDKIRNAINEYYEAPDIKINEDFINRGIDLKDPQNHHLIFGVVPAVFIVNKEALNGREIPTTWEALISGEFKNSLSIPTMDLDLYNAIVLTIYAKYGTDGLKRLKDAIHSKLHPAQMVKAKQNDVAAVSIAPYFFASMVASTGSVVTIWPEDGAIISPIFLTVKKDTKNDVKPALDYLLSKEIGEIFNFNGKFPTINTEVNNDLFENQKFLFAGWDLLNNISKEKKKIDEIIKL